MDLKHARIKDDTHYEFEFEERYQEQNVIKKTIMRVRKHKFIQVPYASATVETENVQKYIVSKVRDLCVYIADKEDRELFYKTAEFIVKAQDLPINIKTVVYPGSSMILIEYGLIGISSEEVKKLEVSILDGFSTVTRKEEPIEEVEEVKEESLESSEEDFPFGGTNDDFVENDDFVLGEVEEEGEKDD